MNEHEKYNRMQTIYGVKISGNENVASLYITECKIKKMLKKEEDELSKKHKIIEIVQKLDGDRLVNSLDIYMSKGYDEFKQYISSINKHFKI